MQAHAEKNNILNGTLQTLIGSYMGEKIILATPQLKWYLEKGLKVTPIYEVIKYHTATCFKNLIHEGGSDDGCARWDL